MIKIYSPAKVANSIVKIAQSLDVNIDPLKIQKLLYFSHGWSLAINGRGLINEPFHAWKFGPVLSSVYHEFKRYGNGAIKHFMSEIVQDKSNSKNVNLFWKTNFIPESDQETLELLKHIIKKYAKFSAITLSHMTHLKKSPWHITYENGIKEGIKNGKEVPNKLIMQYFQKQQKTPAPELPVLSAADLAC
jgi:uncharacterized phage-associated protein